MLHFGSPVLSFGPHPQTWRNALQHFLFTGYVYDGGSWHVLDMIELLLQRGAKADVFAIVRAFLPLSTAVAWVPLTIIGACGGDKQIVVEVV